MTFLTNIFKLKIHIIFAQFDHQDITLQSLCWYYYFQFCIFSFIDDSKKRLLERTKYCIENYIQEHILEGRNIINKLISKLLENMEIDSIGRLMENCFNIIYIYICKTIKWEKCMIFKTRILIRNILSLKLHYMLEIMRKIYV